VQEVQCRCRATHRGQPVDVRALNPPRVPVDRSARWPFLIVPGFTPRIRWRGGLHPRNLERLERALADLRAGLAPAVIVTGGAVHSPDNEAVLMREWLIAHEVDPARIIVEPCARHTTTNLRNAGRILLSCGVREALVVTSDEPDWRPRPSLLVRGRYGWRFAEQSYYLGFPWLSSFHLRCLLELGYRVGELEWLEPMHVRFRPSQNVFRMSPKETRDGDP
jgi:hypothetical protein